MSELYEQLQWLPAAPPDFADVLKGIAAASTDMGLEYHSLAACALDLNQATKLGRAISKAIAADRDIHPLIRFRLALLGNSTTEMIVPVLVASAARHGIALELIETPYGQFASEALNPDSKVNRSQPDAVLFALDYHALPMKFLPGDSDGAESSVQGILSFLRSLRDGINRGSKALCIFQNFAPPAERVFGSLDCMLPGTFQNQIREINRHLQGELRLSGDVILDIAGLAETVGLAEWHSPQLWNIGKLPFADKYIPLYGEYLGRTLAAIRGKSRKALVLDLDNTVWGGVIGDDGIEGIKLAQGDAVGEAHLAVQQFALYLRQRGIVLAVSSKNTDEIARQPFELHPEMLLKLDHIAVFQANWNDKATNIEAIARELNIGLDALVFLDDNPVERGLIRKMLPQVAVPELPYDPSLYVSTLAAAGYFEATAFANEDLKRAEFYQDNARRAQLQEQKGDLNSYLVSLDMTITFMPFEATGRARIVQLINKSNQFNLTTRRYTEPEVEGLEQSPDVFTLQARLEDVFGDNGMICVVICRVCGKRDWEIDTWLMSCRVLGRKVEQAVLGEILRHARNAEVNTLYGVFRPTDRNQLVVDHYRNLGFEMQSEDPSGETRWSLSVCDATVQEVPMHIVSQDRNTAQDNGLL